MSIEFNTIYGKKTSEEIASLLIGDIRSALSAKYGTNPDSRISERVHQELIAMEQSETILDVAALYELSIWLKENNIPYWMRGCAGSSFILYLLGVTCGNPLPPHYHCPRCQKIHWVTGCLDGFDLPQGKLCEKDGTPLITDGHNIPWQSLWGYGDYCPSFDIVLPDYLCDGLTEAFDHHWLHRHKVFSENKASINTPKSIRQFFNLWFSFSMDCSAVHKSFYDKQINADVVKSALISWQTLANYNESYEDEYMCPPYSFADLISLLGILHSTGTWDEATVFMTELLGYSLSDMIAHREDIYQYLLSHGFLEKDAWRGMKHVQNGLELPVVTAEMKISHDKWILDRCERIKYLFPKAHTTEYIMFQLRASVLPE